MSTLQTHGIPIKIDWEKFKVGTSFFIPGIDQDDLIRQLRREMQRLKIGVQIQAVVENSMLGVRVWRTR
jgi:hypothetical protein